MFLTRVCPGTVQLQQTIAPALLMARSQKGCAWPAELPVAGTDGSDLPCCRLQLSHSSATCRFKKVS